MAYRFARWLINRHERVSLRLKIGSYLRTCLCSHQAFLHDRRNQTAVTRIKAAAAKASSSARVRALLVIEHPLVSPERAMKPKRMIEAGDLRSAIKDGPAMTDQGRVQQRHV